MAAKFVLKKGSTGKFRFNLVARTSTQFERREGLVRCCWAVRNDWRTVEVDAGA